MAELFHHTDKWGDTVRLVEVSNGVVFVHNPASGSRTAVHLTGEVEQRLLDALLIHLTPKDDTDG